MTTNKKNKTTKNRTGKPIKKTVPLLAPQKNDAVNLLKRELEEKITSLTKANRQLKREIFDLYTIFEISRNFNAVLNYEQLLDTFIFTSLAQVGASKSSVYLAQKRQDELYVVAKHKGSGKFPDKKLGFKAGTPLINYLTKLNRPATTHDIMKELANDKEKKILDRFHPGLVVPLIYQSNLSGLLLITDKISGREFTKDDIEFLSILGNQISVAIENTRLYEAEKQAIEQLRSTQQQLVHSERLAALGEMSAKVAHEINNPLGIIKNYILLIRQAAQDNNEVINFTKILGEEIDRIARIVRELLDFHRPKGLEFQKVDVAKVLGDVLLLIERQLENKNIKLIKRFDPHCPQIEASPENLKQVFLNIIINAGDVMNEGGTLDVSINCDGERVLVKFCDTGPGIPPENIPRIFEPFFSTKGPSKGTGLGLSVCYGIVKRHNGTITYNNLDSGGCFEIKLPINKSNDE